MYTETLSVQTDHSSLSVDTTTVERLVHYVVEHEGGTLIHLNVVLTDHQTVRELNRSYLDHDYNTDVLAFSLADTTSDSDENTVEGEVYVDLDTANERHEEFDTTFERESYRYVVHGLLHLLGYDDASQSEREEMRIREDRYLNAIV